MDITLAALNEAALEIGKAVILYADPAWDGVSPLTLSHLGDTEGAVKFTANEQIGKLMLPEVYGDAAVDAWVTGADPVLTAPLFLADPALRSLVSPSGDGVIGTGSRRPVARKTLVIMPQALFYDAYTGKNTASVSFAVDSWTKTSTDPEATPTALTTDEQRLLGLSIWMWSCYPERPPVTYEATVNDVVKNIEEVTFHAIRPKGATASVVPGIVTIGDPADYDIDIVGTAS